MKRRSARPFVVEVKSARSSRSPLTDAFTRTRSSTSLWQGVSFSDEVPPSEPEQTPHPAANVQPSKLEAQPARRVLPALVPLYVPSEPEPQGEVEETPTRRASPVKAKRKPRSRPVTSDSASIAAPFLITTGAPEAASVTNEPASVSTYS